MSDTPRDPKRQRAPSGPPTGTEHRASSGTPVAGTDPHHQAIVYLPGAVRPQPARAEDLTRLLQEGRYFALDIRDLSDEEAGPLLDALDVDRSTRPFLQHFGSHPAIVEHGDDAWLVLVAAGTEEGMVELHVVVGARHLILSHDRPCPALERHLHQAHLEEEAGERRAVPGAIALHHLTDAVVDTFSTVLDNMDDEIDQLELEIFRNPNDANLRRLFEMRRNIVRMRRVVVPQRDMFSRLASRVVTVPTWTRADQSYFQVTYEQFIRLADLLDSYRDLLSGALDVHLSTVSNRMGEVNKQLTLVATIFLPLSFLTGFFGQNFGFLVDHIGGLATFLWLGIGSELVAIALLYWFFRRRGWLRSDLPDGVPDTAPPRRRHRRVR